MCPLAYCADTIVLLGCTEEQDDGQEEHADHDEVEYLGTSNGAKADEAQDTSLKDESAASVEKAAADETSAKEPDPDFTVTPSKDGQYLVQCSVCVILNIRKIYNCNLIMFPDLIILVWFYFNLCNLSFNLLNFVIEIFMLIYRWVM